MKLYEITRGTSKEDILAAFKKLIAEKSSDMAFLEQLAFVAAEHTIPDALTLLFDAGVNPAITRYSATLLHEAAKRTIEDAKKLYSAYIPAESDVAVIVNLLLDKKISALRKDENGLTAYHYAARCGNYRFVEALAQRGVKLTLTDQNGNTGIHMAAKESDHGISGINDTEERLKMQIEQNFPAESIEQSKKSLKEYQIETDNFFKTIKAFAEGGVDITEKNNAGETAQDIAVINGAKKIAAFLAGNLSESNDETDEPFVIGGMNIFQAITKKDYAAMESIIRQGIDLSVPQEQGKPFENLTPLDVACAMIDATAAEMLLKVGADANFKDNSGCAAIAYCFSFYTNHPTINQAVKNNQPQQLLEVLLAHGFSINSTVDDEYNTALTLACKTQHGNAGCSNTNTVKTALLDALLQHNADVNISNRLGETPLMWASKNDFARMENFQIRLLEEGSDVAVKDKDGNTALHYAAANQSNSGAKSCAEMLLEFGADANAINNAGKTAMDYAIAINNEPLVKLLLSKM